MVKGVMDRPAGGNAADAQRDVSANEEYLQKLLGEL
jgi:hypothetical protein